MRNLVLILLWLAIAFSSLGGTMLLVAMTSSGFSLAALAGMLCFYSIMLSCLTGYLKLRLT